MYHYGSSNDTFIFKGNQGQFTTVHVEKACLHSASGRVGFVILGASVHVFLVLCFVCFIIILTSDSAKHMAKIKLSTPVYIFVQ